MQMQPEQSYSRRFGRRPRLARVVHPSKDPSDPILDAYLQPVTETRHRLRGCRCAVPCLGFTCASSHHRGPRATPWCKGGDDPHDAKVLGEAPVERCDDCWAAHEGLQRAVELEMAESVADAA